MSIFLVLAHRLRSDRTKPVVIYCGKGDRVLMQAAIDRAPAEFTHFDTGSFEFLGFRNRTPGSKPEIRQCIVAALQNSTPSPESQPASASQKASPAEDNTPAGVGPGEVLAEADETPAPDVKPAGEKPAKKSK
jgi:hypothetical protein